MGYSTLGYEGLHIYCSSSVRNFKEKLDKKFNLPDWNYSKIFKSTLFFGLYHWKDYLRFIIHRGPRYIFWCGSDILNLNWLTKRIFLYFKAKHYCENRVELEKLLDNGIISEVQPLFLGDIDDFPISYKQSNKPQVWLCMHPGREEEYGIATIMEVAYECPEITFHIYGVNGYNQTNVIYHRIVPEKQFNEEIKNYQAGLRLNEFDGFSEVLTKSILLGQYPISRIQYPYIDSFSTLEELIFLLKSLKLKLEPNIEARDYWYNQLE